MGLVSDCQIFETLPTSSLATMYSNEFVIHENIWKMVKWQNVYSYTYREYVAVCPEGCQMAMPPGEVWIPVGPGQGVQDTAARSTAGVQTIVGPVI